MIFLLKVLRRFLLKSWNKYHFYRQYGIVLPQGCIVNRLENISLTKPFSMAENCLVLAQDKPSSITAQSDFRLNANVTINADCGGSIRFGKNVLIGPGVVIRAANHRFSDPNRPINSQGHDAGSIIIGDDVWIGANVVVLPNVTIGQGSVVAAGAVVSRDIPAFVVAGGIPAKKLKDR